MNTPFIIILKEYLIDHLVLFEAYAPKIAGGVKEGEAYCFKDFSVPLTVIDADADKGIIRFVVFSKDPHSRKICLLNSGDKLPELITYKNKLGCLIQPKEGIKSSPLLRRRHRICKRLFDILFSSIFLITVFPLCLIFVFIGNLISSPGPIFFIQKRTGYNGKSFNCYKFRSMLVNAESDTLQATKGDKRVTKFGSFLRRTSFDELPQFINVFRGNMSVVGPRPHMLKHTEQYSVLVNKYMTRHLIRPGITGWAQINGYRGETKVIRDMELRVKSDIWYIEHCSFLLDLRIIYRTVNGLMGNDPNAF